MDIDRSNYSYTFTEYEADVRSLRKTLSEIENISPEVSDGLSAIGINVVSDLLDADMDVLLSASNVDEDSLDTIYEAVQSFVERALETPSDDEELEDIIIDSNDAVILNRQLFNQLSQKKQLKNQP